MAQAVKNLPAMHETWAQSLGWEDPPEKGKATHSSVLAWRIPRTVWSTGSQRVTSERLSLTSVSSPVRSPVGGIVLQVCPAVPFWLFIKEVKEIS